MRQHRTVNSRWLYLLPVAAMAFATFQCCGQERPVAVPQITNQAVLDKTALAGREMHVVGIYSPKNHADDRVFVDVKATGKPIVLVLTSYTGVEWHVTVDPQADVRQIVIGGYFHQEIHSPPPNIPVAIYQYFDGNNSPTPKRDKDPVYFWAYGWHTSEGRDLRRKLKDLTGLEVTTFQGSYDASRIVVDGTRGRNVVADKEAGEKSPHDSQPAIEPKQVAEGRLTLEAARREFESQFSLSEEASRKAANDYRAEATREAPDPKKLSTLKEALEAAVKTAFKNQLLLQKSRLQLAQLDLIELQTKYTRREELADSIVQRRVADLMAGDDLEWKTSQKNKPANAADNTAEPDSTTGVLTGSPQKSNGQPEEAATAAIPVFATPQELLAYLDQATRDGDETRRSRAFVELLDQDEQNRMAGVCLRTASMVRSASRVAAGFSQLGPEGQNAELIRIGKELDTLIKEARLKKPPRAAQSAFEEISTSDFGMLQLIFSNQGSEGTKARFSADQYSTKLRTAAGVLKDPLRFSVDFMVLLDEFENGDEKRVSKQTSPTQRADWQVTIEGDCAIAVNRTANANSATAFPLNHLELRRADDTWRIHNAISDEMIIEIQQGMRRSAGSDPAAPVDTPAAQVDLPDLPNTKPEPE